MDSVIHKSYPAGFKLIVVERAEKIGNRAAAREFNVDEKCVRRWRTDKKDLQSMPLLKKAQRGGVVGWPDLEKELELWIKRQDKSLSVMEIQAKARLMAEQMGLTNFKGTVGWCYRFMKRKKLPVNSKTGKQRDWNEQALSRTGLDFKLTVIATAEKFGNSVAAKEFNLCELCVQRWRSEKGMLKKRLKDATSNFKTVCSEEKSSFLNSVFLAAQKNKLTNAQIVTFDEIPFSFHFVNSKEGKTVPILCAGSENLSFTCILSCAANGSRLKPLVIFKGNIPQESYSADVLVRNNEKGVLTESLVFSWLYEVWRKRKGAILNPQGILLIDSMHKQLFDRVKSECEEMSTTVVVIPAGLKKLLHLLGSLIKKTFENEMMKCFGKWINNGLHACEIKKATPEEITGWVLESWKSVKASIITHSFMQSGLILPKKGVNSEDTEGFEENKNSCDEIMKGATCDNDSNKNEDVNMCDITDNIKIEDTNECCDNDKDIRINNVNNCDTSSEGIQKESVNRLTSECDRDCKEINFKHEASSNDMTQTVEVDEFLRNLYASDSSESEFE